MAGNRFRQPRPPRGGCQTGARPPPVSGEAAPDGGGHRPFPADPCGGPAFDCKQLIQKENARSHLAPGAFR